MSRITHIRRGAAALAFGLALTTGPIQGSVAQAATPTGRVCIFSAPGEASGAGHVAWAFQTAPDRWTWGSYTDETASALSKSNWAWGGPKGVLHYFQVHDTYKAYRCKNTHQRLAVAATNQWKHLRRSEYDVLDNNCLTTTLKIFRAYSRELKRLPEPSGMYKLPRVYFDRMLPHFGFLTRGSL
ncbi:hypothetical protein ABT030_49610 [Streptomyces mirabilis]|uniref:hypothetical protein n=1 Tax=Streptomyces mirabilis TaxID=68239 RepID=UPI003332F8C8